MASVKNLRFVGALPADANDRDYCTMSERFSGISKRLRELVDSQNVLIDDGLPEGIVAKAKLSRDVDGAKIQIRKALVSQAAQTPEQKAEAVLVLIHETAHTLKVGEKHRYPIVDISYRGTWSEGHLTTRLALLNADTYAETAARLLRMNSGNSEAAGSYTLPTKLADLREKHRESKVGRSLALANIVMVQVARRSGEYLRFASESIERNHVQYIRTDHDSSFFRRDNARTLGIEMSLIQLGVIERREKGVLGNDSRKRVQGIVDEIKTLLDRLESADVKLAEGPLVAYSVAGQLRLPLSSAAGSGDLAMQVLRALMVGLSDLNVKDLGLSILATFYLWGREDYVDALRIESRNLIATPQQLGFS